MVALNKKKLDDPTAVPTHLSATEKLITKLESEHASCAAAAEEARHMSCCSGSCGSSNSAATAGSTDVFKAMMRLQAVRKCAEEANSISLTAEKARDAAQREVTELEHALDPKRLQTEDTEDGLTKGLDDWDLADHRRESTRVMTRRNIQLGESESARALRTGKDGYLEHPRV